MEFITPDFADLGVWISLLTLCFLEIVLGIDNIIFISIVAGKLPEHQQRKARNIGLTLAMVFRVGLLLCINWIVGLVDPVVAFKWINGTDIALSWKDIILLAGGLFLIVKSTLEIHHKLQSEAHDGDKKTRTPHSLGAVLFQIVLVDAVFSFDSILTAVGLVENVIIMIIAVIVSILIMMLFAGPVTRIINKQPTLQMLALTFLIVIGVVLIASGFHQEISKSIIYSCLGFSLIVELLNIRLRGKNAKNIELNTTDVD
ncbi:TerC family protein [Chitinophaga sp. NPDC101104]|uniref:TerC family protein n=1 Tax=Chitinophaga sp. NPDC101104 TaxID=3390561 RepID=UPI003D06AEA3